MTEQTTTNQTPATCQNDQNKPPTIRTNTIIDKLRHQNSPKQAQNAPKASVTGKIRKRPHQSTSVDGKNGHHQRDQNTQSSCRQQEAQCLLHYEIRLTYKAIRYLKGRQRLDIQELSIKKIMFATNPHKPAKLGEITTKRQQRDLGFSENSGGGDLRRQKVKRQHQKTARLIAG